MGCSVIWCGWGSIVVVPGVIVIFELAKGIFRHKFRVSYCDALYYYCINRKISHILD